MRILVTNDDGIHAPGLETLERIARTLSDDVWVVAPAEEQSGAGHSLSLADPIRYRKIDKQRFEVAGTPTDCVVMAVRKIMPAMPDLVLSGVNRGQNIAEDVTYSGTIAGAFEGTQLGVRSIAVSQAYSYEAGDNPHWETPIKHAPALIRALLAEPWGPGVLMNVNFPDRGPDAIEGVEVTRQGRRDQQLLGVDARHDTWGTPYYWLGYAKRRSNPERGTDIWAVYNGWISVTPLNMNLTDRAVQAALKPKIERKGG